MTYKYSDIIRKNRELKDDTCRSYEIFILSNVMVHQGKDIIEYALRGDGVNADVVLGEYNNIIQDSQKLIKSNAVIIFFELANMIDGLQYKAELLSSDKYRAVELKIKSEIDFVIKNLVHCPLLLINRFSSVFFSKLAFEESRLDRLSDSLNYFLENAGQPNIRLIDLDNVISNVGINNGFSSRYYYSSKAPYTVEFFKSYAEAIKPLIMAANGKAKKALIFDCDNTLWKGVLGEDGINGIELSAGTKYGMIFQEIQSIALLLNKQGVILGLCSKNNLDDIDEVFIHHKDMVLQDENISIKAVNWSDKVTNLIHISNSLNIGLDSMVFVDDSDFEVNLVREQLPDVTVIQVPDRLYEYPQMLRDNFGMFYNLSLTNEDTNRIEMYRQQMRREEFKAGFTTIDEYLGSLGMSVTIYKNEISLVGRMAQMTQKTNQFNLTTTRYTDADIEGFIAAPAVDVFAFSVIDKYGDSGITAFVVVDFDDECACIDSFMVSCRVIGRNVEYVVMDYIIGALSDSNIRTVVSTYKATNKNKQVECFYDNCSFDLIGAQNGIKNYSLDVDKYNSSGIEYIEVINGS